MSAETHTPSGHGHVWPNADFTWVDCGGPGVCHACTADAVAKARMGEFARSGLAHQYAGDPELTAMLDLMKNQLLIVLVNRLGGSVAIPSADIDATGQWTMEMRVDEGAATFHFTTRKKQ